MLCYACTSVSATVSVSVSVSVFVFVFVFEFVLVFASRLYACMHAGTNVCSNANGSCNGFVALRKGVVMVLLHCNECPQCPRNVKHCNDG